MQAGFEVNLDCFLWDLVDEGIEDALDRIKGETGVTGIVVPVHGRALTQFRPHPGVSPRRYVYDGGALFQPESSRYAGTRIRPVVTEGLRKANPLKTVAQACHARGLKIGCAVSACDCPPVADRHGHATVCDVFGDRNSWLCPVNPDVQEYVRALLADLAENYGLDSIRLGDLEFSRSRDGSVAVRADEHRGFTMGPLELWLRTICFCESCRQLSKRGGIEVDSAVQVVGGVLSTACQTGNSSGQDVADFVEANDALLAYMRWQTSQWQGWIPSLKATCGCSLILEDRQEVLRADFSLREIPEAYDQVLWRCPETSTEVMEAELDRAEQKLGRSRVSLWLSAGAECPNADALVRTVVQTAKMGCQSANIGDYGSIPLERLEWIRQAVRFARREAI